MDKRKRQGRERRRGFTFIEIIAVLVLIGILALFGGRILVNAVRGYVLARESDAMVQKAQVALQRMTIEFSYINKSGTSGNATSLNYDGGNVIGQHTISQQGSNLLYSVDGVNYTLLDGLAENGLQFGYHSAYDSGKTTEFNESTQIISISLTVNGNAGASTVTRNFRTRVTIKGF